MAGSAPEACGMGYPALGLSCVRRKGHHSAVYPCFGIRKGQGFLLWQDRKEAVPPRSDWPKGLVLPSTPAAPFPAVVRAREVERVVAILRRHGLSTTDRASKVVPLLEELERLRAEKEAREAGDVDEAAGW